MLEQFERCFLWFDLLSDVTMRPQNREAGKRIPLKGLAASVSSCSLVMVMPICSCVAPGSSTLVVLGKVHPASAKNFLQTANLPA